MRPLDLRVENDAGDFVQANLEKSAKFCKVLEESLIEYQSLYKR